MDVFEALADPVRRALLVQIAAAPTRVVDLAEQHPISRPAVSKHLRLLSEAGLVSATDRGRERHYALVPDGLAPFDELVGLLRSADPLPGPLTGPLTSPLTRQALDALDTEVRRTVRERRTTESAAAPHPNEETA